MVESLLLRLTVEELCLLQGSLGIDELPGFETNLLSELDDAQRIQALRTAAHTLRARGLVGWDETAHPRLHPAVAAIVLDYAHPCYTFFVDTFVASKRVLPFLYVIGQQAIYEQCQPEPDVLQLRVLDQEALWKRLLPKLRQEQPPDSIGPDAVGARFISPSDTEAWQGEMIQSVLQVGVEVARENEEAAYRLFANFLSQPLAQRLAAAYHNPEVVQYMARWRQTPTQEHPLPEAALTIVQGQEWSFLLWVEEPQKGDEALVAVRPAAHTLLQAYIMQLLPPSLNA